MSLTRAQDNFDSPSETIEIDAEINHSILISRCKNTTIRINGKANALSLDNSSRTSLIIDSLVSSVDVIKCPNFALQVLGTLPTILLDQVDGATVYLSKDSLATEVFTSKCSSININLPTQHILRLLEAVVCGERGTGLDFVET